MTPATIIYHRRVRVLETAREAGVTGACRTFGVSRTSYYRWKERVDRYGLDALWPKDRRRPSQPNETPTWIVEIILAEAVVRPTLGCRQLTDTLAERGIAISASGLSKVLRRHNLSRRSERVQALAALTAVTTGLVAKDELDAGPFGFCHWAARPGDLVGLDAFYVGNLKGVGRVWQLTAVDTATRWAVVSLIVGNPNSLRAGRFLKHVIDRFAELGVHITRVLTDNGPEFIGPDFRKARRLWEIEHVRTPPRSPNHNAVCERFQGTVLDEFYRPAFHRRRFERVNDIDRELQSWIERYNYDRPNHGDYMRGATPFAKLCQYLH